MRGPRAIFVRTLLRARRRARAKLLGAALVLVALAAAPALAADYVLFTSPGVFAKGYSEILDKLVPGDTVKFSDGTRVTFDRYLGAQVTTFVFADAHGDAWRIPLRPFEVSVSDEKGQALKRNYRFFINEYVRGQKALAAAGVPVPVLLKESVDSEYAKVELIHVKCSLKEFLREGRQWSGDEESKRALRELEKWARTTAPFVEIDDFRTDQIVWDGGRWVLLDFHGDHRPANEVFPMDNVFWRRDVQLPDSVSARLVKAVMDERRLRAAHACGETLASL